MATLNKFSEFVYWKKITFRTFTARESMPGFKGQDDSLLEGNAAGYFKLKAKLIHHAETPRALKICTNSAQPCAMNRVKAHLLVTWFIDYQTHC